MRATISTEAYATICEAALAEPQLEVCGLLVGRHRHIETAIVTANVAANPACHFEIDPVALLAVARGDREGRATWAGHFHSHPTGDARPSLADAALAHDDGKLWLIAIAGADGATMTAWAACTNGSLHGAFEPIALAVI